LAFGIIPEEIFIMTNRDDDDDDDSNVISQSFGATNESLI
jgi:hypothetical protein